MTQHLPWFQMYDPWVTREMTVRRSPRASQRAGSRRRRPDVRAALDAQPRRDRAAPPLHPSRDELPQRLCLRQRALRRGRPAHRGGQRQDLGALRARGRPRPRRHAHRDLGPRRSPAHANRAWPHARRDGPMHGMGTQEALDDSGQAEFDPELGANAAPAGGVAASANDMGRWIAIQLARGALPEGSGTPVQRSGVAPDVDAARAPADLAVAGPHRRGDAAVQRLRPGVERAGLSRPPAHDAHAAPCSARRRSSC